MKTSLITILTIILAGFVLNAQQQVDNPGFEDWEDVGSGLEEPVDWSSIKTSDNSQLNLLAPVVWEKSSDGYTGDYCVKLFNVAPFPNLIATGTISNGRTHADMNTELAYVYTDPDDDRWHTVFTQKPDSVAFWMKYFPMPGDTAQIQVLLHVGEATLPPTNGNQDNWIGYVKYNIIGTYDSWTRFSAPITYSSEEDPEYVLIILTSGNGTSPIEGSYAFYDDLEFIYNPESVEENPLGPFNIYYYDNSIYIGDLYSSFNKGSNIEIINMNGSTILSTTTNSDHIKLQQGNILNGIYIIRISDNEKRYSQKIFIR